MRHSQCVLRFDFQLVTRHVPSYTIVTMFTEPAAQNRSLFSESVTQRILSFSSKNVSIFNIKVVYLQILRPWVVVRWVDVWVRVTNICFKLFYCMKVSGKFIDY